MLVLVLFAFVAGIVTILSPCILPVLPIILSGSVGGRARPLGIVVGFVASFTLFTLTLSSIVRATGLSSDFLRNFSMLILLFFGLSLTVPRIEERLVRLFSKINFAGSSVPKNGFSGGLLIGLSLGLVWTPCVGPILASVISLALTGSVTASALFITLAYALGTGVPMLIIAYGGRTLITKNTWLLSKTEIIRKIFGILMMLLAVGLFLNLDRQLQTWVLEKFPNYGIGLTRIEENKLVDEALSKLKTEPTSKSNSIGQPLDEFVNKAPDFIAGGEWINSQPLSLADLKGKVVLVDFWTYTCINCIRTLPYLKSWNEKYKDKGLVIIGVHTPEFEFEKNLKNVQKAAIDFGLTYSIMQDNNYSTWNAYRNRYWPAKYFVDKKGVIRQAYFGEGHYDESEKLIQTLLNETSEEIVLEPINNPTYQLYSKTPEIYLGHSRLEFLDAREKIVPNEFSNYTFPNPLQANHFALKGSWLIGKEVSQASAGSALELKFDAKEVFLVMRSDKKTSVRVLLDGKLVDQSVSGKDVKEGQVIISDDRLYHLINLPKNGVHILRLEFIDEGTQLYAFTFG